VSRTFESLKVRNFRIFSAGNLLSNVGTWMQRVAQDWLVLVVAGSAGALAITTGLQFLPTLLLSPIAGVVADRFPKRIVVLVAQIAMALCALALGLLALAGVVETWHIYLLSFLFGCGSAFDVPARQAFVNEMVDRDRLPNAIALNSASFNLARMIGPAVAGLLISALGSGVRATGWVILANAASYVAVLISILLLRRSELIPTAPLHSSRGQLATGLRYVRSRPDIMLVMAVVFCAGTFGLNFQMTTALMATRVYAKGAGEYGILGSLIAVGSLAGSLAAARRRASRQRLVIVSAAIFGLTEVVAGLMPSFLTYAIALPFCGVAALTAITAANAFVQMTSAPEVRGRVMALYMMIFMGGTPFGSPLLGWIADQWGARWTVIGGGALTTIGTLAAALLLSRRQGVSVVASWDAGPRLHIDRATR